MTVSLQRIAATRTPRFSRIPTLAGVAVQAAGPGSTDTPELPAQRWSVPRMSRHRRCLPFPWAAEENRME